MEMENNTKSCISLLSENYFLTASISRNLRHRDKIRYAMLEKLKKEKLMQKNNFLSIELSSSGELINCISAAAIITGC